MHWSLDITYRRKCQVLQKRHGSVLQAPASLMFDVALHYWHISHESLLTMDQDGAGQESHTRDHYNNSLTPVAGGPSCEAPSRNRIRSAPWVCLIIALFSNLASRSIQLPLLRICELGVYRKHYAALDPSLIDQEGNMEERLCKLDSIQ